LPGIAQGDAPPACSREDLQALEVWRLVSNGMGGMDAAWLPYAVALHEVDDVEGLIRRLTLIKSHRPNKSGETSE
jgi:hypothetical protein